MNFSPIGRRAVLLGGLASLGAGPASAAIPLDLANGRCIVSMLLNGHPARMVLDTGAERTVVTPSTVQQLGLRKDIWVDSTMRGAGGLLETHANTDVDSASIGGTALFQRQSSPGLSLSVANFDLGDADGLLGGDVLRHYTLDLDFPRTQLTLRPANQNVPRPGAVQLSPLRGDLLLAPVQLDGHSLLALVDTGASVSLINARGLYRLGLTPQQLEQDQPLSTMSLGGKFLGRMHRFTQLRLGPLTIIKPWMLADKVPELAFDLTLGLDVLGSQRLLLSYADLALCFDPV
jgi:predicted aspartyl protease